jgi:CrcB-like protein, Camphor Resistance (CrcB)
MTQVLVWSGVALVGGVGSVLRFVIDRAVARRVARAFPFGTLAVNISGAFLLGFLGGLALSRDAALVVGTGFVGASARNARRGRRWPTSPSASPSALPRQCSGSGSRRTFEPRAQASRSLGTSSGVRGSAYSAIRRFDMSCSPRNTQPARSQNRRAVLLR